MTSVIMRYKSRFLMHWCAGLAVAALLLSGCKPPAKNGKPQGGKGGEGKEGPNVENVKKERVFLSPVLVRSLARGEIRAAVGTTGSIIPIRSVALRTEEAGRLHYAKEWREGDLVTKGEVIATVESEDLKSQLLLNKADVEIQKESLDIGEKALRARLREYRTLQDLYAQGIAAQKEVDAVKLELDRSVNSQRQSQISLAKAESRVREVEARMERLAVTAPYDGLIVAQSTLEGQGKFVRGFGTQSIVDLDGRNVSAGQFTAGVVDTSQVLMRCDVTSKDVGSVHEGVESEVTVYARENVVREGKVVNISESVDPETRAFQVDILLDNSDGALKPGMFGKAEVITERRRDTIHVPKSVVTRRNNLDVVFVADKQTDTEYEVAKMTTVELGLEGKDDIEVTFGLKAGDRIITRGFEVLQDNTPINAIDEDAPLKVEEDEKAKTVETAE
ncbi:efflux RND transporter periplasmic adaptor subunit [Candidatus Poribacteria bacterium]|nr:efflux RND transporter periplasmic adaptor subunit [Candidatus Poribacteria bacterium]